MHRDILPRRRTLTLAGCGLLALLLALASCGTPSTGNATPTPTTPAAPTATSAPAPTDTPAPPTATTNPNQVAVRMSGGFGSFKFSPDSVTIKVGTAVVWTNNSSAGHTVTSDPGSAVSWDSGLVNVGGSFAFTFTKAGTYTYHCSIHPSMTGTIIVTK